MSKTVAETAYDRAMQDAWEAVNARNGGRVEQARFTPLMRVWIGAAPSPEKCLLESLPRVLLRAESVAGSLVAYYSSSDILGGKEYLQTPEGQGAVLSHANKDVFNPLKRDWERLRERLHVDLIDPFTAAHEATAQRVAQVYELKTGVIVAIPRFNKP